MPFLILYRILGCPIKCVIIINNTGCIGVTSSPRTLADFIQTFLEARHSSLVVSFGSQGDDAAACSAGSWKRHRKTGADLPGESSPHGSRLGSGASALFKGGTDPEHGPSGPRDHHGGAADLQASQEAGRHSHTCSDTPPPPEFGLHTVCSEMQVLLLVTPTYRSPSNMFHSSVTAIGGYGDEQPGRL